MQTNHELIVEPVGLDVDALPKPLDWREVMCAEWLTPVATVAAGQAARHTA